MRFRPLILSALIVTTGWSLADAAITADNLGTYVMVAGLNSSTTTLATELSIAKAAGFGYVRFNSDAWDLIEPSSGTFSWTVVDRVIVLTTGTATGQFGLKALFTFPISASWNAPGGCPGTFTPTGATVPCTHFATTDTGLIYRLGYQVASHYGAAISAYEAWNEPDFGFFWNASSCPVPSQYYTYLLALSSGIRAGYASANIVMGGLAFPVGASAAGLTCGYTGGSYMNELLTYGTSAQIDALNVHIYPAFATYSNTWSTMTTHMTNFSFSKPVYVTETSNTGSTFDTADTAYWEKDKANWLYKSYAAGLGELGYAVIFWHTLCNPVGYQFSQRATDCSELNAARAQTAWNDSVAGGTYVGTFSSSGVVGWQFVKNGLNTWVLYRATGSSALSLTGDRFVIWDNLGRATALPSARLSEYTVTTDSILVRESYGYSNQSR